MKKTSILIIAGAFLIVTLQCAQTLADTDGGDLHKAVRAGNVKKVISILDGGADINALDERGMAPLHYAAGICYRKDIVQLLLDKGADSNVKNKFTFTPILFAVQNDCAEVAKLLIDRGADFNIKYTGNGDETPLHRAATVCGVATVLVLISAGADVNAIDNNGMTPIFMDPIYSFRDRSSNDCVVTETLLLGNGARANVTDKFGATLLTRRAYDYALFKYEGESRYRPVKLLLDHGAKMDPSAAALLGDADFIKKHLDSGGGDATFQSVQHIQFLGGRMIDVPLLSAAALGNNPEVIEMLITQGSKATVPEKQPFDKTWNYVDAVETAVKHRKKTALATLLKHKDEILSINDNWMLDNDGLLYMAMEWGHPDREIVKMITDFGIQMNIDAAICLGDKDFVRTNLGKISDINEKRRDSEDTLLIEAIKCDREDMAKFLLQEGADPNAPKEYVKPLIWAVRFGRSATVSDLIKAGANVEIGTTFDEGSITPLQQAAEIGSVEIANILLDHGANINAKTKEGTTPFDMATTEEMREFLLSKGAKDTGKQIYDDGFIEFERFPISSATYDELGISIRKEPRITRITRQYARALQHYNHDLSDEYAMSMAQFVLDYSVKYDLDPRLITAIIVSDSKIDPKAADEARGLYGAMQITKNMAEKCADIDVLNISMNIACGVQQISAYLNAHQGSDNRLKEALGDYYTARNLDPAKRQKHIDKVMKLFSYFANGK